MKNLITKLGRALLALNLAAILTSMAAMEIFSWLLFVLVVVELVRRRIYRADFQMDGMRPVLILLGVLWLSLAVGAVQNIQDFKATLVVIGETRWILLLPTFALAFRWWLKPEDQQHMKWWWCLLGLVSAYAAFQFLTGVEVFRSRQILYPFGPFWRATGLFNMPLTFAAVLGMCLCVTYAHLIRRSCFRHPLYYAIAAIGAFAMVASLSRGAWLSFGVALLTMFAVELKPKHTAILFVLGLLVLGLGTLVPGIGDRLIGMLDFQSDTYRERFELWRANYAMFQDHALLGVGYGENYKHLPEYFERLQITRGFISHAHNTYFQWLGGTGLIGFTLFVSLLGLLLKRTYSLIRGSLWEWGRVLALGLLGAQVLLHFNGLTEASFFDGEVNHTLMMVWGLVLALPLPAVKKNVPVDSQ
ncbi:MAG: O-antigen ligase family protein [Bdellovibrionales bacterium]